MIAAAKLHAPSLVCLFWALLFAADLGSETMAALALATLGAGIVLHTCEIVRMHRRHNQ